MPSSAFTKIKINKLGMPARANKITQFINYNILLKLN